MTDLEKFKIFLNDMKIEFKEVIYEDYTTLEINKSSISQWGYGCALNIEFHNNKFKYFNTSGE